MHHAIGFHPFQVLVAREEIVDQSDGADARDAVPEGLQRPRLLRRCQLQRKEVRDRLQIVLDPMVGLADGEYELLRLICRWMTRISSCACRSRMRVFAAC